MMLGPSVAKGFATLSENPWLFKVGTTSFHPMFDHCFHHKKFHVLGVHKVNILVNLPRFWAKPVDFVGNSHGAGHRS